MFGSSAPGHPPARGPALVEVRSLAIPGQLRAWWVPRTQVGGAWIDGEFVSVQTLRATAPCRFAEVTPCSCPLADLVREQQDSGGQRRISRTTQSANGNLLGVYEYVELGCVIHPLPACLSLLALIPKSPAANTHRGSERHLHSQWRVTHGLG